MSKDLYLPKGMAGYLMLTAALCGALVMMIEVMGSRVIGPFFGVSLFVWTSLITVTLVSLALGYGIGGVFSDRYDSPRFLYLIILGAGVLSLLLPLIKGPVLELAVPMGLRLGAFVSTLILFGPVLFLLGCVSPYLVKIAARQMRTLGRTVGGLYALSTVGSTLGTVITGFVLVAYLGVDKTFFTIGFMLIILASGYFILFHRQWYVAAALLLPWLLFHPTQFQSKTLPDGSMLHQIYHAETHYGTIKIVDNKGEGKHLRYMLIDGLIQGGMDMHNSLSPFTYSYHLQFLPYMLNPQGQRCLTIGMGAGAVPRWFEQQGIPCDVVDIDPEVLSVTEKFFNYRPQGQALAQDGRYFLVSTQQMYDYIILDAFSGDLTPAHLLSVEALQLVKQRLHANGVLAVNLIGNVRGNHYMTASVVRTLQSVFDQVELYPTFDPNGAESMGNLIVVAYSGQARQLAGGEERFKIHPHFDTGIRQLLGTRFHFPQGTPAMVLTDDYNPIDFYDSDLRELVRERVLQVVDWDLLLS